MLPHCRLFPSPAMPRRICRSCPCPLSLPHLVMPPNCLTFLNHRQRQREVPQNFLICPSRPAPVFHRCQNRKMAGRILGCPSLSWPSRIYPSCLIHLPQVTRQICPSLPVAFRIYPSPQVPPACRSLPACLGHRACPILCHHHPAERPLRRRKKSLRLICNGPPTSVPPCCVRRRKPKLPHYPSLPAGLQACRSPRVAHLICRSLRVAHLLRHRYPHLRHCRHLHRRPHHPQLQVPCRLCLRLRGH